MIANNNYRNVKQACFILYYSWKTCYVCVLNDTLAGHYEDQVMEAMNVLYTIEAKPTKQGCVAKFGVVQTNDFHSKLKARMKDKVTIRRTVPPNASTNCWSIRNMFSL
jgi:hypothetical protein